MSSHVSERHEVTHLQEGSITGHVEASESRATGKVRRQGEPVSPPTGLVSEHALTRTVRDSAALLDATSGLAPGDPYIAPPYKWSGPHRRAPVRTIRDD